VFGSRPGTLWFPGTFHHGRLKGGHRDTKFGWRTGQWACSRRGGSPSGLISEKIKRPTQRPFRKSGAVKNLWGCLGQGNDTKVVLQGGLSVGLPPHRPEKKSAGPLLQLPPPQKIWLIAGGPRSTGGQPSRDNAQGTTGRPEQSGEHCSTALGGELNLMETSFHFGTATDRPRGQLLAGAARDGERGDNSGCVDRSAPGGGRLTPALFWPPGAVCKGRRPRGANVAHTSNSIVLETA